MYIFFHRERYASIDMVIYAFLYIYINIHIFRLKVVQLEELLQIRHCVFVMGPPGAGKTQAWKTLAEARYVL